MKRSGSDLIELSVNSKPIRFYLSFNICKNPDCDCNGTNIRLTNQGVNITFFFDFKTESGIEKGYDEEASVIIRAFTSFVKSQDNTHYNLDFFKKWYESIKYYAKLRKETIDSFKSGDMIDYFRIFSEELPIVEVNGKRYEIIDSYCVMPDCDCTDVSLNFFECIEKLGKRTADFSFLYNYMNMVAKGPINITEEEAEDIALGLGINFQRRHKKLKRNVRKDILKKLGHDIKNKNILPAGPTRKLGRNEPCHCGSGKKYKKCCLYKDLEEKGTAVRVRV